MSLVFKHRSVGSAIDVVLVRMIIIDTEHEVIWLPNLPEEEENFASSFQKRVLYHCFSFYLKLVGSFRKD
jgi:hypothetical protein